MEPTGFFHVVSMHSVAPFDVVFDALQVSLFGLRDDEFDVWASDGGRR